MALGWTTHVLCTLVLLLEASAYFNVIASRDASPTVGILEMALLLLLAANGIRLRHMHPTSHNNASAEVADWTLASLLICLGGDLVNRNFQQHFYMRDTHTQHSYLADSVWFFAPGYAAFIVAAWRATSGLVSDRARLASLVLVSLIGILTFWDLLPAGTGLYVTVMTGPYTVVIALMVPAGGWIAVAFGGFLSGKDSVRVPGAWAVAVGAVLATVADAIIGHFWLFPKEGLTSGFYPAVAYLNFVIYFTSQALMQQLPVVYQQSLAVVGLKKARKAAKGA